MKTKQSHRLFIKVRDESRPVITDEEGRKRIPTVWIEVLEANLGSYKKPNKKIFAFEFRPIKDDENRDVLDVFKGFKNLFEG